MPTNQEQTPQLEEIDLKEILFKLLGYWKLFAVTIFVTLFIAWLVNRYTTEVYQLSTLINIKESENPLAGSSVNLLFKMGGPTESIQSHIAILKSRSHNANVIERLQMEVEYYSTGRVKLFNAYGQAPFRIAYDKTHPQLLNVPVTIEFSDNGETFQLFSEIEGAYALLIMLLGYLKR